MLRVGNFLVAGGMNGNIMLWSGKNNKGSRLYNKIYEKIQSTNFELP